MLLNPRCGSRWEEWEFNRVGKHNKLNEPNPL